MTSYPSTTAKMFPAGETAYITPQENGSLWDRLCDSNALRLAWLKVRQNGGRPGVDGVSTRRFERFLERNLGFIQSHLNHYQPLPYLRIYIDGNNGKKRALDIPCVRDRVVLRTLLTTLVPATDRYTPSNVFGYTYGRGAQAAVQRVEQLIGEGKLWAFRSDIQDFFGSIERPRLMEYLREITPDERILCLINKFLNAGTKENGSITFPGRGIAQGSCLSPMLSNIYLRSFDTAIINAGYHMLRYADDILVLATSRAEVRRAASLAGELLTDSGLGLNRAKTSVTHMSRGIEFLGFVIDTGGKKPGTNAIASLNRKIERINHAGGMRIHKKVKKLRQLILGWLNYFGVAAAVPVCDRLGSLVLKKTKFELQNKGRHYPLPLGLRNELSAYLNARRRLEAAADEVRRIESGIRAGWKDNPAASFYLRRIFCHA